MTEIRRTAQDEFSDLVVVERRQPVPRSLEGMHGVYTLDGWRDANGESREFACEIVKISPPRDQTACARDRIGRNAYDGRVSKILARSMDRSSRFCRVAW